MVSRIEGVVSGKIDDILERQSLVFIQYSDNYSGITKETEGRLRSHTSKYSNTFYCTSHNSEVYIAQQSITSCGVKGWGFTPRSSITSGFTAA